MKHFIALLIMIAVGFPGSLFAQSSGVSVGGVTHTSTSFDASFTYQGTLSQKTTFYAWIAEQGSNTWIKRDMFLTFLNPSPSPQTANFTAQFNYGALGLSQTKKYVYQIMDGTTSGANPFTNPACFTPSGGAVSCLGGTTPTGGATCTNPSGCPNLTLNVLTVSAPETSLHLNGELLLDSGTLPVHLDFYLAQLPGLLTSPFGQEPAFEGTLTTNGASFLINVNNLEAGKMYYYKFIETETGLETPIKSFVVGQADNQAEPAAPNPGPGPGAGTTTVNFGNTTSGTPTNFPGSPTVGLPSITVNPPTLSDVGTLNIPGTIGAPLHPIDVDFVLYLGTSENDLNTAGSLFTGNLTASTPFTKSIPGQADGTYFYEIRDVVSGYSYGVESFTVGDSTQGSSSNPSTGANGSTTANNSTTGSETQYPDGYLKNPLGDGLDTFPEIFARVYTNIILPIVSIMVAISLIYAGFKFVIARKSGATDGYADAKRYLKYALIGAALGLGGLMITNAISSTLCELVNNCPATTALPG